MGESIHADNFKMPPSSCYNFREHELLTVQSGPDRAEVKGLQSLLASAGGAGAGRNRAALEVFRTRPLADPGAEIPSAGGWMEVEPAAG